MGGSILGVFIELLVATLLVVTIAYCVLVNRKLVQLRSDQSELKVIVRELHAATGQAEQAIAGLRQGAQNADRSLGQQIDRVRELDEQLSTNMGKGEALLVKLSALSHGQHVQRAEPTSSAKQDSNAPRIRHSALGLGLLNAQRRSEGERHPTGDRQAGKAA